MNLTCSFLMILTLSVGLSCSANETRQPEAKESKKRTDEKPIPDESPLEREEESRTTEKSSADSDRAEALADEGFQDEELHEGTPPPKEEVKKPQQTGLPPSNGEGWQEGDEDGETRSFDKLVCQEGPAITKFAGNADFSTTFSAICANGEGNARYKAMIENAYDGQGELKVEMFKNERSADDSADLILGFAVKVKGSPSSIGGTTVHNLFAAGIEEAASVAEIEVKDQEYFPGRKSAEMLKIFYDISKANGASVANTRLTEINSYLLSEKNLGVALTTEHLLEGRKNENYDRTNALVVTQKDSRGHSVIMMISDFKLINMVDGDRLIQTMVDINTGSARLIHKNLNP